MKRIAVLLAVIIACCMLSSCGAPKNDGSVFAFLSVRLKGNGDGTVTATAKNEFALGNAVIPVELTLYRSVGETAISEMYAMNTVYIDDLNVFQSLSVDGQTESNCWFCAQIAYEINGETKFLQTGIINYGADGKRIKDANQSFSVR